MQGWIRFKVLNKCADQYFDFSYSFIFTCRSDGTFYVYRLSLFLKEICPFALNVKKYRPYRPEQIASKLAIILAQPLPFVALGEMFLYPISGTVQAKFEFGKTNLSFWVKFSNEKYTILFQLHAKVSSRQVSMKNRWTFKQILCPLFCRALFLGDYIKTEFFASIFEFKKPM